MKHIFLIRHGQSKHNAKHNSLSGVTDIEMTDEGRKQCEVLGKHLAQYNIEQIFSSPLSRAKETAAIVFPNHQAIIRDSLIELNYGTYEGFDRSTMTKPDPIIDQWNNSPADLKFPNGDHVRAHGQYVYKQILDLIRNVNVTTIACVSHRSTIRLLVSQVIGLPMNNFRALPCSNCSVTELSFKENLILDSLSIPLHFITSY